MKYKLFIGQPWFGRISSNKQGGEQKKVAWRRKKVKVNWQEEMVEEISLLKLTTVYPEFHKPPLGLT